jgi:nickel-type superoxide dismutase maturation protease
MWRGLRVSPVRRFVVQDTSMQPLIQPGDRLLVLQWRAPKAGDLAVMLVPDAQRTYAVKRVASIEPNGDLVVRGDNPNVSRDSRDFGPVPRKLVVGTVVYRYGPSARRGPLSALR